MAPPHVMEDDFSEDSQSAAEENGRITPHSDLPLTYAGMSGFAADIKATFSAAITDLKSSMLILTDKMATAEHAGRCRDKALNRLDRVTQTQSQQLIEINKHLEDLDNRGRRNNIRVRGIPETVEADQITPALQRVFNSLLERPEETDIEFVRAHRALRARGPDNMPPRDIICCLQSFALKEDIMRKTRRNDQIVFNGETIMLFHDLSQITLKNRRALRPLLDKLREKDLRYSWRFPFALLVNQNGRQHILRSPEDLPDFCQALHLEQVELPEWYQEFMLPPLERSPFSSPDKRISKKMKSARPGGSQAGTPNNRPHTPRGSEEA